jgi:hypothetical protein
VDDKLAIMMFSTLLPSFAVGYVLRTSGKTLNFAVFGATVIWVVSAGMIYAGLFLASRLNMPLDALIIFLPIAIAAVFYFLFKGMKAGNEE